MHTNNLVINDSTAGQAIKGVAKLLPHFYREATAALVIESVNTVDTSTFMVAAEKKEILRILDLVSEKETNDFQRLLSTINVVSQEKVVGLRRGGVIVE